MSNLLMAHAGLMDSAVYTASSEATGFTVENVNTLQPSKAWRSTSKTSQYIVINLGTVSTFDFVGLFNTNIINDATNTIRIRTADTEAGLTSAPDYDSTAIRAIPFGAQGDYSYSNVLFELPAAESNQWVRIDLTAPANTDAYISIGRVYVSSLFTPAVNLAYGGGIGYEDKTTVSQALGGASWPAAKPKLKVLTYSLTFESESDLRGTALYIDRLCGASKDVFVHEDIDNLDRYMDNAIYGLQASLQPVINTHYNLFSKRYTIRELL